MPVIRTLNAVPDDVLITGIHCIRNIYVMFRTKEEKKLLRNKVDKLPYKFIGLMVVKRHQDFRILLHHTIILLQDNVYMIWCKDVA